MLIPAASLPEVVFVGTPFNKEKFDGPWAHYVKKPGGCLWTSPIRDGKSEWEHYMVDEKDSILSYLSNHKSIYSQAVKVDPEAKVFLISNKEAALYLEKTYNWDWTAIAEDYDAVYVDKQGVLVMYEGHWDLPSVVFFNLDYVEVDPRNL